MPITKVTVTNPQHIGIIKEIADLEDKVKAKSVEINARVKAGIEKLQTDAKAEFESALKDADAVILDNFERLRNAMGMTKPFVNPKINVTDLDSNPPVATITHGEEAPPAANTNAPSTETKQ